MKIDNTLNNNDVLSEIGLRIRTARTRKAYTQSDLARYSGVSKGTIEHAEKGESIQFVNLIRILRELDAVNALDSLLPSSESTPMELISESSSKVPKRQRVRKKKERIQDSNGWRWGDEA